MNPNWPTAKLRNLAEVRVSNVDKKTRPTERCVRLCNYMDVYSNDYVHSGLLFMDASASPREIERFRMNRGDVIITKDSESPDDIGIPAVLVEEVDGLVCGYHLALIRPNENEVDPIYLAKQLSTPSIARYFALNASGSTRFGLPIGAIESAEIPKPSKREQTKIAEILSTVDRAIEQTEALIAKQQRIKTGLMQDLLTRGIDEHGNLRSEETHEFKDSPLGRIPVEWNTSHLSAIADLQVGYAFKSSWFSENGIRLLRGENVGAGTPDWKDTQRITPDRAQDFKEYLLNPGDFVIGMDRTFTQQGFKLTQLSRDDTPCLLVQRVGRFIPHTVPADYLKVIIRSPAYRRDLKLQQKGMDIPHLSKTEILSPVVPVPSSETEMLLIAERIEEAYRLEAHYQSALEKAQRLKLGLMQDLLTGKRRVTPLLELENTAAQLS